MTPREGVGVSSSTKSAELSANVGQPEVPEEVEMEVVLGGRESTHLELTGVQNLESEAPATEGDTKGDIEGDTIVAHFDRLPEPTAAGEDLLAAMLKESASEIFPQFNVKPIPGREFSNFGGPTEEQLARSIYHEGKTPILDVAAVQKAWNEVTFNEAAQGFGDAFFAAGHAQSKEAAKAFTFLGELPNGDCRATVRISEVYVEGCKQQAEADGVSLEDWLTGHLGGYLENWWSMPGSK
jgi:hypothetical protein